MAPKYHDEFGLNTNAMVLSRARGTFGPVKPINADALQSAHDAEADRRKMLAEIKDVLSFYADPRLYCFERNIDPLIPDFYRDLNFGDLAAVLLAKLEGQS